MARLDQWGKELGIGAGLFVFTLLSRVPFRSQVLYHWDSVNFAYAVREFSVAKEQPHPPGYILYVWLCRLVDVLFNDPQTTMVWISIVASGLAVAALFYLGRTMFDQRVGLIAALLLASSPLFWFYGEIALPHALDTLLVVVSVWWLFETMKGDHRYLHPAVALTAIAGGVRQQTLVFLLPLLLFALRRVGWRRFLTAGVLGGGICAAWFLALMVKSGGVADYASATAVYGRRFADTTSVLMGAGWSGILYNIRKLTIYTLYGWNLAMLPGWVYLVAGYWQDRRQQRGDGRAPWEVSVFWVLWIVPSSLFYATVHMGQQGLIFVFLPALFLLSGVGMTGLLRDRYYWLLTATAVLVALNGGMFCLVGEYPLGPGTQRLLTQATLANSDDYFQERFDAIMAHFPSGSTLIIATNWHHVEYYLPTYRLLPVDVVDKDGVKRRLVYREDAAGGYRSIYREREMEAVSARDWGLTGNANGTFQIVVFDPELSPFLSVYRPEAVETIDLPHTGQLLVLTLREGVRFSLGSTIVLSGP